MKQFAVNRNYVRDYSASCNHRWRDTPLPTPKQSADDLLESVKQADIHGWWLKGIEFDFATELLDKGLVSLCEKCKNSEYDSRAIFINTPIIQEK